MNSAHDLGGMQGFGPVRPEPHEPVFHAEWERHALAMTLAMGATGLWNLDASRHARESLPAATYLGSSYYGIWLAALERLLVARGAVTAEEWASGELQQPGLKLPRILQADQVDAALAAGSPTERPSASPARFAVGQAVRTRLMHPATHTRLPRYARGREGVIARVHGPHVLADANAHRQPGEPEVVSWLYSVCFDASALWGESAEPRSSVHLDLWETHLLPVNDPQAQP